MLRASVSSVSATPPLPSPVQHAAMSTSAAWPAGPRLYRHFTSKKGEIFLRISSPNNFEQTLQSNIFRVHRLNYFLKSMTKIFFYAARTKILPIFHLKYFLPRYECRLTHVFKETGIKELPLLLLSFRAVSQKPVDFFIKNAEKLTDHDAKFGLEDDEEYKSDDYRTLFNSALTITEGTTTTFSPRPSLPHFCCAVSKRWDISRR